MSPQCKRSCVGSPAPGVAAPLVSDRAVSSSPEREPSRLAARTNTSACSEGGSILTPSEPLRAGMARAPSTGGHDEHPAYFGFRASALIQTHPVYRPAPPTPDAGQPPARSAPSSPAEVPLDSGVKNAL